MFCFYFINDVQSFSFVSYFNSDIPVISRFQQLMLAEGKIAQNAVYSRVYKTCGLYISVYEVALGGMQM
jgi:hypothetical protein